MILWAFNTSPCPRVLWELWEGIEGMAVVDLTSNPRYLANSPTRSSLLLPNTEQSLLEVPEQDVNDNLGNRLTTDMVPRPTDGGLYIRDCIGRPG